MKRLLSNLILAAVCAAASAQGNTQIDSLFAELKEIFGPEHTKHLFERYLLNDGIGTALREYIFIDKRQHGTDLDDRMGKAIALIRRRLDLLADNSNESYRYVFHKNGIDTIQYAINLTDQSVEISRFPNIVNFSKAAEDVTFNYCTDESGQFFKSIVVHSHRFNELFHGLYDNNDSFRHEDFNKMIAKLMERKGVTRREIHWQNPMPGTNESNVKEKYYLWWRFGDDKKGVTNGVIYSVPVKNAVLAADILRQLGDSIHGFFEADPHQVYQFYLDKDFTKDHCERVLIAYYQTDSHYYDGCYDVYLVQDEKAFHFLFLDTRGMTWIPKEF